MVVMCMAGMSVTASADDLYESFTTNTGDSTYTGEHFTISVNSAGDSDGFVLKSLTGLTATISAKNGETITKLEVTKGCYETNDITCSDGTKSVSGDVATFTNVNKSSVTLGGSDTVQVKAVKVYYTDSTPAQPPVTVLPNADAGDVIMDYDSDLGFWICDAVPASGYTFVKWTYSDNNSGQTKESTNDLFYYYTDLYSNLTAVFESDTPAQPTVTVSPNADAGSITYNYNQESSQWELTAVPATGYKFVHWAYFEGEGHAPEPSTSTDETLIVTDDMEDLTAYFEAVTEADEIDISEGTVTVDVSSQSVTVTVDGQIVPASEYHVIFFTYEEIDGGESVERVGAEFPTAEGTYIAAVVANDDSELYTGENRSKPFTVSGYKPEPTPTPTPSGIIQTPTYPGKPAGSPAADNPPAPQTGDDDEPETAGGVKDVTNTDENVGGAFIDEELADLVDAVLDEETKAAIANGESVEIYLTVTDGEYSEAEAALAEKLGYTVGKFLDISLYVKNGDVVTQVDETGMIKVSIELPEELKNTDPDVLRRFAVLRIHNGVVQILTTEYDPETNILSFLTDRFSSYIIAFVDEAIAEPDPDTVIDEDDDDTEEVEVDADTDKAEDAPAVVDAGETNPHTGVTADAFALVLLAGAVMFVSRKRK